MRLMIALMVLLSTSLWAGKEYDEALKMIRAKKYDIAKVLLDAELKKDEDVKVHYALGFIAESRNDDDLAVKHYKRALMLHRTKKDKLNAGRALTRLLALRPSLGPIMKAASELEREARKSKDKAYIMKAADMLEDYILSTDIPKKPKVESKPVRKLPPRQKPTREVLVGVWNVQVGATWKSTWTFKWNHKVESTTGKLTGTWKIEEDKKRVYIKWDNQSSWDSFSLPLNPKDQTGDSHAGKGAVKATKVK